MGKVNFDKIDLLIFITIGIGLIGLILSMFFSDSLFMPVYCGLLIVLFVGILLGKNVFSLPDKISIPKNNRNTGLKEGR